MSVNEISTQDKFLSYHGNVNKKLKQSDFNVWRGIVGERNVMSASMWDQSEHLTNHSCILWIRFVSSLLHFIRSCCHFCKLYFLYTFFYNYLISTKTIKLIFIILLLWKTKLKHNKFLSTFGELHGAIAAKLLKLDSC